MSNNTGTTNKWFTEFYLIAYLLYS